MPAFTFNKCLGAIETVHPLSVPPGYASSALNVDLSDTEFLRPRAGTTRIGMTSGPAAEIVYLFADNLNSRLWAFVAATGTAYHWSGSAWSSISLGSDYSSSSAPHCVAYNGKVFVAFDGTVNRLHVYDTDGVFRRVGVVAPAAATVANTGAGAYAATLRYYKIQMRVYDSQAVQQATSELSAAVSFTPSGAGTHARITKPTTVDGATHWVVYGSADGVTYYRITGTLPVATTTYDDNVTPSTYSGFGGGLAPEVGLFVPPPSCKFLATNGERIFMAGAYETTAGSGETTPNPRRVWFTRPLGVTDEGDDEAITQTALSRYHIDINNEDGGAVTGLMSTLDGSVYAFTSASVWRLVDTGATDTPVRAERVSAGAGALSQYLIATGDTDHASAVYFMSSNGPYRYSLNEGAVFLGADWVATTRASDAGENPAYYDVMAWDPVHRRAMVGSSDSTRCRVFTPGLFDGRHGGWCRHIFAYGRPSLAYIESGSVRAAAVFGGLLYLAGQRHDGTSASALMFHLNPSNTKDDLVDFPGYATITTGDLTVDAVRNMSTQDLYVWKARSVEAAITLENHYGPSNQALVSDTAASQVGYDTDLGVVHRDKVEGTAVADVATLRLTVSVTGPGPHDVNRIDAVVRVDIPYKTQEVG